MMGKATTGYTFGPGNNRLLTASTKMSDSTYSYDADGSRGGPPEATSVTGGDPKSGGDCPGREQCAAGLQAIIRELAQTKLIRHDEL